MPGTRQAYDPDPKHPSGLSGEEVYKMEQGQRYRERMIREKKREYRGATLAAKELPGSESAAELTKAKTALQRAQKSMRDFIAEANDKSITGEPVLYRHYNREWCGDMPGTKHKIAHSIPKVIPKGALNDSNDPDSIKRDTHAKLYYEEIKNSDRKTVIKKTSS